MGGSVEVPAMPIRAFLAGKSFDPETLAVLNAAFEGACADLAVTNKAPSSRELLAREILRLADGQPDPQIIRKAVVGVLTGGH
jgi:hypothetical protein